MFEMWREADMRYLKASATIVLALLFLAPAALAQDTAQDDEGPAEDLPVLGDVRDGAQPDLPAQPDMVDGAAGDGADTAPAPAAADTGGDEEILPVTGAPVGALGASGAGLLVLGSALLLLVRRVRGVASGANELLRDVFWTAD